MSAPNREQRAAMARDTLAIVRAGAYRNGHGDEVDIAATVRACIESTRLFLPDDLAAMAAEPPAAGRPDVARIDVRDENTIAAAMRLVAAGARRVGVLNFASARNPGGGFEGGSQAQEEALARSSALHASLTAPQARPFYAFHRAERSCFYSDRVILSPDCPLIRDADGVLLPAPVMLTFLTCAAPNARAISADGPRDVASIPSVMRQRADGVLRVAARAGCDALVLGAWGCGVFGNEPARVADVFARLLGPGGAFAARFERVTFAILDSTRDKSCVGAFRRAFQAGNR